MRAIQIQGKGKAARLTVGEAPDPEPGPGEVRIRTHATALNRADLLQKRGLYPPPPGASEILGLECAGVVDKLGEGVSEPSVGARVMALLPGGGYAEQAPSLPRHDGGSQSLATVARESVSREFLSAKSIPWY